MADEPTPETPAAAETNVDAALEELKTRVARAEAKNTEYEKLMLDPVFLNYLSSRNPQGPAAPSGQPKADVDLDAMSNRELTEYILRTMTGMLAQTVVPVQQQTQFNAIKAEVDKVAAAHSDYWDYQEEMIRIGRAHPTMSAEEAYLLAKSRPGTRKVKSGEVPGGGGSTKREQPKGFEAAFAEALKVSGIKGNREE